MEATLTSGGNALHYPLGSQQEIRRAVPGIHEVEVA